MEVRGLTAKLGVSNRILQEERVGGKGNNKKEKTNGWKVIGGRKKLKAFVFQEIENHKTSSKLKTIDIDIHKQNKCVCGERIREQGWGEGHKTNTEKN